MSRRVHGVIGCFDRAPAPGGGFLIAKRIDFGQWQRHARRHDLVEGRDGVPRTDLAGVLGVVVEILLCQDAVFISDQAISATLAGLNST